MKGAVFDSASAIVKNEIRCRSALDGAGKSVDVFSLQDRESVPGRTFHCLGCREPMVARLTENTLGQFSPTGKARYGFAASPTMPQSGAGPVGSARYQPRGLPPRSHPPAVADTSRTGKAYSH